MSKLVHALKITKRQYINKYINCSQLKKKYNQELKFPKYSSPCFRNYHSLYSKLNSRLFCQNS